MAAAAALTVAGLAAAGPAHAATAQYALKLSPILGANYLKINDNGDILGVAPEKGAITAEPFLLKAGAKSPLFLSAVGDPGNTHSLATPENLNNAGDVTGESVNVTTGAQTAVLWADSSAPSDLGQLPGIANTLYAPQATDINNNSVIIGYGAASNAARVPYTIAGSAVGRLPVLPGNGFDAYPIAISDTGVIVGEADSSAQDMMAVKWVNGAIVLLAEPSGVLTSEALAVNASGTAVGAEVAPPTYNAHAIAWANGQFTDLGFPDTRGDAVASAISTGGVVVGSGALDTTGARHAFIYQNGTATDLNTLIPAGSGVTLTTATGINSHGDIVGTAVNSSGQTFGFELTPAT
jgi:probable HAF family extracellular repeat protein